MLANIKQSKINCNTLYCIIANKTCFNEHTKNNEVTSDRSLPCRVHNRHAEVD